MADWQPPRQDLRCMRIGLTLKGTLDHHYNVGRSCSVETDSIPEPQRPKAEKCGPTLQHWEAADV